MSLKWPAHKASERIARNNAVKIAAAFVAGIDAKKVVEDFMSIHPQVTDNAVQDRVRARAWAIVHVRYNSKPMEAAIRRTYADGWVTGDKAAKQLVDSLIKKADDWSSWTPGSEALAQMVAPKGALAGLLENAGVVSNQLWATKLDEVGTILANGLRDGSTVDTIATNLEEVAGGESKAMVIARTELNRAMTQAAVSRYQDSGIDQVEWEAADPDDECADNDGEVVTYGEEFPSGDIEPPVHPNCRCGLLPVIAEAQTDDGGENLTDDATPDETDTSDDAEYADIEPITSDADMADFSNFQRNLGFSEQEYPEEGKALTAYTSGSGDFSTINTYLRDPESIAPEQYTNEAVRRIAEKDIARAQSLIQDLDSLMVKAPALEKPILTYRGVKAGEFTDRLLSMSSGDSFTDAGFTSTSHDPSIANRFAKSDGAVLEIVNPAGSKGIDTLGFVAPMTEKWYAEHPGSEKEWLLPRNLTYKVLSKDGNKIRVITEATNG